MRRFLPLAATLAVTLISVDAFAGPPGREGAFNFRGGGFFPAAESDFWDETQDNYTLDSSDLNGLIGGLGYSASLGNFFEFDANADAYWGSALAADRDFEDDIGNSILHDTRLFIAPLTVGFRWLPAGRYAKRGKDGTHFVRRPVPYLGGGIGMAYWQYEEEGDFVFFDPSTPSGFSIAYDRVQDSGLEFETHAQVGIEFPISPDWNLTFEVRRSWAEADLSDLFPSAALTLNDPRHLDLGGTSVMFGASLRF